ncbi:MAG TPA: PDDEXK nuclease domain-containing protein, partial [Segetibacter sp.]
LVFSIGQTSAQSKTLTINPERLIAKLSFSHLVELFEISDPLKRTFYEIEAINGTWSVRALRRQINSLYYERSGLSKNPKKLSAMVSDKTEALQPSDVVKSVYTFEFLGLKAKDVVEENDLEKALLDNLQQFLVELGHGFCFEGRQQKILIGDRYYFIDLVFYHRILKCHVLIDLKVEEFDHINAGQLNTYLNYYKKEVMQANDSPPVGILMVTNKDAALVEYATAGMDNMLFVSKYLVQLPSKEQLQQFVENELRQW